MSSAISVKNLPDIENSVLKNVFKILGKLKSSYKKYPRNYIDTYWIYLKNFGKYLEIYVHIYVHTLDKFAKYFFLILKEIFNWNTFDITKICL